MYFSYFFTGSLVVAFFGQATLAAPAVKDVLSGMTIEELRELNDFVDQYMKNVDMPVAKEVEEEAKPLDEREEEFMPVVKEEEEFLPVAKEEEEDNDMEMEREIMLEAREEEEEEVDDLIRRIIEEALSLAKKEEEE